MKFETLGENERILLLKALDMDINNLKCEYCKDKVNYFDCGIMPSKKGSNKDAIITCDSPLCITTYLEEVEESDGTMNQNEFEEYWKEFMGKIEKQYLENKEKFGCSLAEELEAYENSKPEIFEFIEFLQENNHKTRVVNETRGIKK